MSIECIPALYFFIFSALWISSSYFAVKYSMKQHSGNKRTDYIGASTSFGHGPSRHFSESRLMSETALGGRGDLPGWGVSGGYSKVSMLIRFVRECDCWCHCRVNVCGGQCCVGWSKTPGSQRCTKRELWQFFCIMHVLGFSLCSALHHLNFTLKTCLDKGIPLITLEVKFSMV